MYGFEAIGSFVLVIHGLLGMGLIEHMKKIGLIKCLNYYTKHALIFYTVDILLRTAIYLKIVGMLGGV